MDNQIKLSESKTYNGYDFVSRSITLRTSSILLKKMFSLLAVSLEEGNPKQKNMKQNVLTQRKNTESEIIHERNSLEESDIIEEVTSIVDNLL